MGTELTQSEGSDNAVQCSPDLQEQVFDQSSQGGVSLTTDEFRSWSQQRDLGIGSVDSGSDRFDLDDQASRGGGVMETSRVGIDACSRLV